MSDQHFLQLKPGVYEHYKGQKYVVLMTAMLEANLEPHVVYVPLYDAPDMPARVWLRPLDDFTASVDYHGLIRPRFRYLGPS